MANNRLAIDGPRQARIEWHRPKGDQFFAALVVAAEYVESVESVAEDAFAPPSFLLSANLIARSTTTTACLNSSALKTGREYCGKCGNVLRLAKSSQLM